MAGFGLATVLTAAAQTPPVEDEPEIPAAEATAAPDAGDADTMKDIDISKLDWSELDLDTAPLTGPDP